MTRTRRVLLLCIMSYLSTPAAAQTPAASAAGCYAVRVGSWDRRVQESTRRAMPRTLTIAAGVSDTPNSGRLIFDAKTETLRPSYRTPSWMLKERSLELMWGDKFSFTVVTLKSTAAGWKGTAVEKTDVISMWWWRRRPRASVELTAQPCS